MNNNKERLYLVFQADGYSPTITDAGKKGITHFYQRNGLSITVPYTILATVNSLENANTIVTNYINNGILPEVPEEPFNPNVKENNPQMELLIKDIESNLPKSYFVLYYDIDNFKIVSSHAEYSAVRDYAKDLGVDSNKIIVKLSTNDKDIANTIIINLKEEKYKVEELRVQEEMLAQPIITKLDIYISRLKESGLDNIVKTPELKAAYRDWLKESGYDYTEDFESYETINATEI